MIAHKNIFLQNIPISMNTIMDALKFIIPNAMKLRFLVEGKLTIKRYKKRAIIINKGEICTDFMYIYKGIVRGYCFNDKQEPITVWFMHEKKFAGSISSYVTDGPSSISIQAVEDCTLVIGKKEVLEYALKNYAEIGIIYKNFINQSVLELEETAILLQSKTAFQRYEDLINTKPLVIQRAPLGYVASYLGITAATLRRMCAKLQE
jgi:CRP-like cAMP-binding protein